MQFAWPGTMNRLRNGNASRPSDRGSHGHCWLSVTFAQKGRLELAGADCQRRIWRWDRMSRPYTGESVMEVMPAQSLLLR